MKKLSNWVCHKNKIPIDPKTGGSAKSNDSTTWGTYEQAKALMERDKSMSGLGFMFGNSPYVGIDIDHCIQDKKFNELSREIIAKVQSYTEISPSGTGVHIICKGKLDGAGRKNSELGLEMYDTGRYFTVTERALKNYKIIGDRQQEIDEISEKYFKKSEKNTEKALKQQAFSCLEDEKLLEIAKNSQNGTKFNDLYNGNWQTYYKSQSEADLAFCNLLAFWTGRDDVQMDRIFRTSGLMRKKWDEKHGFDTYGNITINKAIDACDNVYEPTTRDSAIKDFKDIEVANYKDTSDTNASNGFQVGNLDRFHKFNNKGQITGVFDAAIVNYIVENENIIRVGKIIYLYQNGVYKEDRDGAILKYKIQKMIYDVFQNARTITRIHELILIQPSLKKDFWELNQYPESYINFQNGMLNVKTMELLPHSSSYFAMNQIPHEYKQIDDLSKFPYSQQFLKTSLHNDDVATVFQYMGVCMTHSMLYQVFLLLKGEGANGKSLLINMFNAVVGEQNTSNVPMDKLVQKFYPAQLLFKLINTCADIPKITIEDDAELKKIIGGDTLQAEFKGKDSFSFKPYVKLLFSANRFPHVDDRSEGFKRRLRVIEMDKKPPNKDINLKGKMLQEIDFWVYMAVQNLRTVLEEHDIYESENSKKTRERIYKNTDSVYSFIADCLTEREDCSVRRSEMFKEYDDYCNYYERIRVSKRTFFEEMQAKGFQIKRNRQGYVVYQNVALKLWKKEQDIFPQVASNK